MKAQLSSLCVLALFVGCKDAEKQSSAALPPAAATPADAQNANDAAMAEPDNVSAASPVLVEGPSVVATGSVDGAALRKTISKHLRSDQSPVFLLQGTRALTLGKTLCEQVVPRVPAERPVLLKPNLGGYAGFKNPKTNGGDNGIAGRTTDPEFVRGVIRCLRARGHKKITVADSRNADAAHWKKLMQVSGYEEMAKEEGVSLVALSDDGVFDVEGSQPGKPLAVTGMEKTGVPTLLMPKLLAEHLDKGLYISLPKIKTHRFSVISLAIKGLQGTVMYSDKSPAYRQKWRSHRNLGPYLKALKKKKLDQREVYVGALEKFAERMVDVLEVEAPHVVLAEGAPAMSGDGFNRLRPSIEMIAIGGTNPITVDAVGARFLGLFDNAELGKELGGHTTSPLIEAAAQRFGLDLSEIEIRGNGAELLSKERPVHFIAMAPFEINSGPPLDTPAAGAVPVPAASEAPTARATFAGTATITLDGKADEEFWQAAEPLSWSTDFSGAETGIVTQARFAWSKDGLYALFDLEGAGLFTDTSHPIAVEREGLYKEDCVEIFVAPDPSRPSHYFEIEVGPHGHWLDIEVDLDRRKGRFQQAWSSGVRVATTRDKQAKRATIEIELRGKDIVAALLAGARLPMGLFRMEGQSPNKKYLAWSPARTPKPKFHLPAAFGVLVLEP